MLTYKQAVNFFLKSIDDSIIVELNKKPDKGKATLTKMWLEFLKQGILSGKIDMFEARSWKNPI